MPVVLLLFTVLPPVLPTTAPPSTAPPATAPPANEPVGTWAAFTYETGDGVRICRGDTTTGTAECVSGTGEQVQTTGGEPTQWPAIADVPVRWFQYRPPLEKGPVGRYAFFTYRVDDDVRVCTGDTRGGQAVCADGTGTFADARGVALPRWRTAPKRQIGLFRFFDATAGTIGRYAFAAYRTDDGPRVCRMDTTTSTTLCASGTLHWSREPAIQPEPRWRERKGTIRWLRFFLPRK